MDTKRARVIKNVIQAIVVVALGYVVRHKVAETHALVWVAAGWLLTAWVVLRLALALKRNYATFRSHTATDLTLENIDKLTTASMHPWARGYYQVEKMVYRGSWRTLTRKPLMPAGEFAVSSGPNSKLLVAGLLLLVVAGAALCALFLPTMVTNFWPRMLAFCGASLTLLYAAIWIIGERRSLKEGGHHIAREELILNLGIRCSGAIALDKIAAVGVIERGQLRIGVSEVWTVSPGETANVLIELKRATTLQITAFGSPREISKRFIALYVDRPGAFVDAVSRACASEMTVAAA